MHAGKAYRPRLTNEGQLLPYTAGRKLCICSSRLWKAVDNLSTPFGLIMPPGY